MTLPRKANHDSHLRIFPAHGRVLVSCTRRLSGHSVSTTRHNANGIVAHQGSQLGHVQGAANVDHRALLFRDETPWHDVQGTTRPCEAESIVFHGGVASWRGIQGGASRQCPVPRAGTTGPKMDPKETGLWTEKSCSATSRGSQCRAAPNSSSSSAPAVRALPPSAGSLERAARPVKRSVPWLRTSWCGSDSDRAPRCAAALQVQSIVLRGGVASWRANQQRDGLRCQGERFERLFEETFGPNDCRNSVASSASFGAIRSRTLSWHSASAARSARRNSTSRASANLPTKRLWSCSTSCGRASGLENCVGVVTSGEAAKRLINVDLRSRVSVGPGVTRTSSPLRCNSVSDGAFAGSLPLGEIEPSVTLACPPSESSSGDGLGIHQPGSMTRGFASRRQPPSGRARDRAICPAVARFIRGRAA